MDAKIYHEAGVSKVTVCYKVGVEYIIINYHIRIQKEGKKDIRHQNAYTWK